jgi:hypothetical protein
VSKKHETPLQILEALQPLSAPFFHAEDWQALVRAVTVGCKVEEMPNGFSLARSLDLDDPQYAVYEVSSQDFFGQGHGDEWINIGEGNTPLEAFEDARAALEFSPPPPEPAP